MNILVIDAQGGGIGRQVIPALKKACPEACVTAVGTNAGQQELVKKPFSASSFDSACATMSAPYMNSQA